MMSRITSSSLHHQYSISQQRNTIPSSSFIPSPNCSMKLTRLCLLVLLCVGVICTLVSGFLHTRGACSRTTPLMDRSKKKRRGSFSLHMMAIPGTVPREVMFEPGNIQILRFLGKIDLSISSERQDDIAGWLLSRCMLTFTPLPCTHLHIRAPKFNTITNFLHIHIIAETT